MPFEALEYIQLMLATPHKYKKYICRLFGHKWTDKLHGRLCSRCRIFDTNVKLYGRLHITKEEVEAASNRSATETLKAMGGIDD